MSDLNNVSLTGRLTRDAVVKTVGNKGSTLVTFSIANNTGFGQYECTNFFEVNAWGKQAEAVAQYLTKGKQVALAGSFENKKWTGNDGAEHDKWVLTASGPITLLASAGGNNKPLQPANEAPSYSNVDNDEAVF